jgi:hypothetical protein
MRIDKFTWIVLIAIGLLLVAAIVTVSRGSPEEERLTYRTADEPATPVYNAFVALQQGEVARAREQYSARILASHEDGYDPLSGRTYSNQSARRLRILESKIDSADPNLAYVTIALDSYYGGGLFGGGSTSSNRRTLQVIREDNQWKLDTDEYFY